jgi:hypothetical protein
MYEYLDMYLTGAFVYFSTVTSIVVQVQKKQLVDIEWISALLAAIIWPISLIVDLCRAARIKHYIEQWKPQESIYVIFGDETSEDRRPEDIDRFFEDIREVAGIHGFDISTWGLKKAFHKFMERDNS